MRPCEACSVARTLQPAMIVVEDVEDADVVFLLSTNRADLLEPALASQPGRVDQAVHIELPDRESRRRLVELYQGASTWT